MQLCLRGQKTHILNCEGNETVSQLKNAIAGLENLKPELIVLYAGGKTVSDADSVSLFSCTDIEITVGLLGGKVHGSLARAGKVKGQTPKVEKQEKKKKKTGRAKRRIQYNRRFVNVVATFGRRRGPNSNAT
ncbi:hypothetical protein WA026_010069 [Henosepilachna vigintioctopunctata]|uniref:Ubiquitin-like domain-containing protein n=1 Tax=Henosepilachna vigintioctopunctata TaxID=420089 RepID=A0AAW1U8W5_9CUCU